MAEGENKGKNHQRISGKERLRYIGFEVFPGTPKDLFKNDAEKSKLIEEVNARRESGEIVREDCKLLEKRVTLNERIVLSIASLVALAALFLPFYSAYNEVVVEVPMVVQQEEPVSTDSLFSDDSLGTGDSLGMVATTEDVTSVEGDTITEAVIEDPVLEQSAEEAATTGGTTAEGVGIHANEEIIIGHQAKKQIDRDYDNLSGLGSLASIGAVGSHVFGSGFILMLTGLVLLLYTLSCIALPALNIYVAFGMKGTEDDLALKLKKYLKYNWLPVIMFTFILFMSFIGAEYGSGTAGLYANIGDSYGPGVLLSTLSWGIYVSIAAFVLAAAKGMEI